MTRPLREWKVLPHGQLTEVDDGILTVTGDVAMPLMALQRRMTVIRLTSERLLVFSAIALDEDEMSALEDYGRPAFLVVPNDHHRLDARIWKDRYPAMQVVTPEGARAKVEEAVPVDTTAPHLDDPDVTFVTVPGTRGHEAALVVRRAGGTTLVLNDLVGNLQHTSGFGGWLLRRMGFAGDEPHIPAPVKLMLVEDKGSLRRQLDEWAALPGLRRILVSHGDPIEDDPARVLHDLGHTLA